MKLNFFTNEKVEAPFNFQNELASFKKTINDDKYGFFHLTDRKDLLASTKELFSKIENKKNFVQIGIGGSALGPQMLVSALGKKNGKKFLLLDNTDADYINDQLSDIDFSESVFYVVSKSGGTAETIACYSIVRSILLDSGVTNEDLSKYFIFCTDPKSGQLREHVNKNNYLSLEVPSNIGGRFSVLSPVGLLPALFMGLNIDELFAGANSEKEKFLNEDLQNNDLFKTASKVWSLYQSEESVSETVLMPYSSKLKDLSSWFVQLWAESLGKDEKGFTPVPAYGATDQHSQVQLFMEGPKNKCLFLLKINDRNHNFSLNSGLDLDSAQKLSSFSLNELIEAEYQGSLAAFKENGVHTITMELPKLCEANIAKVILFFESLTVIMGQLLKVDPFDQPGVEKGKKYAFEYLNSLRK